MQYVAGWRVQWQTRRHACWQRSLEQHPSSKFILVLKRVEFSNKNVYAIAHFRSIQIRTLCTFEVSMAKGRLV